MSEDDHNLISKQEHASSETQLETLANQIRLWAKELGFQDCGISDTALELDAARLRVWLEKGYHGSMQWMETQVEKRCDPNQLHPNTLRVISVRMNYLPSNTQSIAVLKNPQLAYISRYALGRDYHKLMRHRLAQLAKKIQNEIPELALTQRAFVDSAPVLERALAAKAGLGWVGKNTLILHEQAGSWFFLGELFTNLPLPVDTRRTEDRCGDCNACLKVCPTDAFPRPYELDARRCISYLTIENKDAIPLEFREAMGNRVFGCDDCQAICPWNKWAKPTDEKDFKPRHNLANSELLTLFLWDEATFLKNTEGSAIRRIGYERWQRNLAVGLGNADTHAEIIYHLGQARNYASPMVQEHIDWALERQNNPRRRQRKVHRKKEQGID